MFSSKWAKEKPFSIFFTDFRSIGPMVFEWEALERRSRLKSVKSAVSNLLTG